MTCSASTPKLTEQEIGEGLSRLSAWSWNGTWIQKKYDFKNFLRAMLFVNAVAYVAEELNHHPDIIIQYRTVTIRNWTHAAGGVTTYDFALAARIDALAEREQSSEQPRAGEIHRAP
jgi:4a-hydroxytetrahydrobiopterin dehydratase